jgi:hypothetical protein
MLFNSCGKIDQQMMCYNFSFKFEVLLQLREKHMWWTHVKVPYLLDV